MIRIIFLLLIGYLIYYIYKMVHKPQGNSEVKDLGKTKVGPKTSCPSPKTFVDYIEGKIKGKQKKEIHAHIDSCKDCMDALQAVFSMSAK